jgi:phenylalanyl-tRNA synthetase beta chain
MKVSLNWVRFINEKYGSAADPAPDGVDALVEKIGAQLGAVEEVVNLGQKYQGIIVVKVVSQQKHPNADKLSVCLVDDGKMVNKVKRNKDSYIQIVHGAPNVKVGMLAAWIPLGVVVPSTFDKEPLVLDAREIRGVVSHGMLASAKELALGDEHEGILEIGAGVKPGASFAEAVGLNDFIIDIENKMFTHRPDCFGMLGVAREIAGIQNHKFKSPIWYKEDAAVPTSNARDDHKLTLKNAVPRLVPRFCALVIKDVKIEPSPTWLQVRLSSAGIRPINNIVDTTNFFMLETAQPLHAYDYDKVKTGVLGVRLSKKGENLKLLGGKEIKLSEGAVVITDGSKPIGLGGVMGGADTEVDKDTKHIILECANFNLNVTRKTAMDYGLFTDAATRFTKNQSPRQNQAVIAKAADDILRIAGGRVNGKLIDDKNYSGKDMVVATTRNFINSRLGLNLLTSEMARLLENVEFKVHASSEKLTVTAPFWRTDIEIPEDIVEEVGRLYGYGHLPLELPPRDLAPANLDPLLSFKSRLRHMLSSAGATEVLTYSFVDESLLRAVGQDPKDAYHIRNALSPNLQYYRLSLTPSLLAKVHPNIKAGYGEFILFEIGKSHMKSVLDEEKLPKELERLSVVIASKKPMVGASYYAAKKICDYLFAELRIKNVEYEPLDPAAERKTDPYYDPSRAANIKLSQRVIGRIGEFKPSVSQSLKLPKFCAGFELHVDEIMTVASSIKYQPLNRFPSLDQDLCLRSSTELTYATLTEFLQGQLDKAAKENGYGFGIEPLDIFQRPNDKSHKQTTWRIRLWHQQRTLTTGEVNQLLDKIANNAGKELKAERV